MTRITALILAAAALAGAAALPAAAAPHGAAVPLAGAGEASLHRIMLRPGECTSWRIVSAECSERTCLPPGEYSTGPFVQRQCRPRIKFDRPALSRRPIGPRPTF
jgi:hypothetical protein